MVYRSGDVSRKQTGSGPTHRVDLVDAFPPLVTLPPDPVAVEVGADPVQDLAGEAVVLPLLRVELQNALVHQVLAVLRTGTGSGSGSGTGSGVAAAGRGVRTGTDLQQAGQVVLQKLLEPLVEFQADELRPARSGGLLGGFGWRDGAPGLAGLVDAGAVVIDMSGRHALRNRTHRTR